MKVANCMKKWVAFILAIVLVCGSAIAYAAGQAIIPSFASYIENIDYTARGGGVATYTMNKQYGEDAVRKYKALLEDEYDLAPFERDTVGDTVYLITYDYLGDGDNCELTTINVNGSNGESKKVDGVVIITIAPAEDNMVAIQCVYSKDFIVADTGERCRIVPLLNLKVDTSLEQTEEPAAEPLILQDLYSFAGGSVSEPEISSTNHSCRLKAKTNAGIQPANAYVKMLLNHYADLELACVSEGAEVYHYYLLYTGDNKAVGDFASLPGQTQSHIIVDYMPADETIEISYSHGIEFTDDGYRSNVEQYLMLQDFTSFSNGVLPAAYETHKTDRSGYYWMNMEGVNTAEIVEAYVNMLADTWDELKVYSGAGGYKLEYKGDAPIGDEPVNHYAFEENITIEWSNDDIMMVASKGIYFEDLGIRN